MEQSDLLKLTILRLQQIGVRYAIVGAFASGIWGWSSNRDVAARKRAWNDTGTNVTRAIAGSRQSKPLIRISGH